MVNKNLFFIGISLILGILVGAGLFYILSPKDIAGGTIPIGTVNVVGTDLNQFSSYTQLKNFLKQKGLSTSYSSPRSNSIMNFAESDSVSESISPAQSKSLGGSGAGSYSTTNIQVEGVDEADIVKNDGKYIYTVSGNKVVIVEAYPAQDMTIVAEITNINNVNNLFINKDKLIVFSGDYSYIPYSELRCLGSDYCGGESRQFTKVYVYNVEDRSAPKLEQNISIEGSYNDARMIGDYVYLVSAKYFYDYEPEFPIYIVNGLEKTFELDKLYYFNQPEDNYVFTSVSSINVNDGGFDSKIFLTGYTGTIYSSQNNIYLTSTKYMDYDEYRLRIISEAVMPTLPDSEQSKIQEILDSDKDSYKKFSETGKIVEDYANSLGESEKEDYINNTLGKIDDFKIRIEKERTRTVVHRVSLDGGNIKYESSGEVPGTILNQFSMDEYNGEFRIATTVGQNWWWNRGVNSTNSIYVLNENMEVTGKVEDLASGETIYSVRFMGQRAYLVTFRQVDPLFVIDLKDEPKVLGYLKVTGYSSYLHPYDENHIIGLGVGGDENGRTNGIRVALFDVSDVNNPKLSASYWINSSSSSEAMYEHKAFLFDKEKELLVIPIQTYSYGSYSGERFSGVYVFNIDLDGIDLRGKVTHDEPSNIKKAQDEPIGAKRTIYGEIWTKAAENVWENDGEHKYTREDYDIDYSPGGVYYYYNNYINSIQRSLYMDSVLYTVSLAKIKANDLEDIDYINQVELGYQEDYSYNVVY